MQINYEQLDREIYTFGMIVQTLVESMGMFSENIQRLQNNESIAYPEEKFSQLILDHQCYHNGIVSNLYPERR
jgi:hypothetical protein